MSGGQNEMQLLTTQRRICNNDESKRRDQNLGTSGQRAPFKGKMAEKIEIPQSIFISGRPAPKRPAPVGLGPLADGRGRGRGDLGLEGLLGPGPRQPQHPHQGRRGRDWLLAAHAPWDSGVCIPGRLAVSPKAVWRLQRPLVLEGSPLPKIVAIKRGLVYEVRSIRLSLANAKPLVPSLKGSAVPCRCR